MRLFNTLGIAATVATVAVGGGATVASAYSVSGGAYSSTPASGHTFTVGGAYTYKCSSTVFSGVATGLATTAFTPSATGCALMGLPTPVTHSGTWNLTVTGGGGLGFTGEVEIPVGTTTTLSVAGCTVVVSGPQTFPHGMGGNVVQMGVTGTGISLAAVVHGIAYTATGCPFPSGTDGVYSTNGQPTAIPGITIT